MARYGARLHPMTRPNFVEAEAIQRVVQWCEATGGQLYIVHMSTAEGSDIVRAAQSRGVPVLAETCAQYLVLDDSVFEGEDGHLFACCPQIKKPKRRRAALEGAPRRRGLGRLHRHLHLQPRAEGDVEWRLDQDPHGPAGPRDPASARLHPRRARRPAHAGGADPQAQHQSRADHGPLPRGRARSWSAPTPTWRSSIPRRPGSVVTRRRWRPTPTGRPYEGWELAGFARTTLSRGEVIVDRYAVVGREGRGQWLPRTSAGCSLRTRVSGSAVAPAAPRRRLARRGRERRRRSGSRGSEDITQSTLESRSRTDFRPSAAPGPPTTSPRSGSA